jgi:lysylphosphatidylglycerol synthetase-like protein (DUF2156 family)
MKNFIKKTFAIMLLMCFSVAFLVAQNVGIPVEKPDFSTVTGVFSSFGILYTVLTWIGGYLSPFIPGINKIGDTFYRVAAMAVVILAAFLLFGFKIDVIAAVINFAIANLLHNGLIKPVKSILDKPMLD